MPEEDGTTTEDIEEPTEGATSKKSGSSSTKVGGKTAEEWKASYNGLQASYQKLKETSDQTIADLQRQLAEAQTDLETSKQGKTSSDSQVETLNSEKTDLLAQIETLQSEKATLEGNLDRSKLVMSDFPELAAFEAQGLLPSGNGEDDLKAKFTSFRETMQSQVGTQVKSTLKGTQPAGSGRSTTSTTKTVEVEEDEDYVWDMMSQASRDGNRVEFNKWQAKYDAIQDAKG